MEILGPPNSDTYIPWAYPGGGGNSTNPYFSTTHLTLGSACIVRYCPGIYSSYNTKYVTRTSPSQTDYFYAAKNQTVTALSSYKYLEIQLTNGYTTTIGNTTGLTVTNDLTISNPGTAGGIATTAYNLTLNGDFYLGNTGNALTLNLANRIARSTTGTGTFTMGNNDSHAINVTYASGANWAISIGASGATTPLTFYGLVTFNSSSAQPLMSSVYKNLTVTGSGTRSLISATTVTGDITLNAGTLDVTGSNYGLTVGGNWVNTGGLFTAQSGTVTFDGYSNANAQKFNVTTTGGTTAYDADFNFYNVSITNTNAGGVTFYYKKASRKINSTDVTVGSSSKFILVGQ